jgi:hypothetical protein
VTHLRKMMLEELQPRNHSALPHATTSALGKDLHHTHSQFPTGNFTLFKGLENFGHL